MNENNEAPNGDERIDSLKTRMTAVSSWNTKKSSSPKDCRRLGKGMGSHGLGFSIPGEMQKVLGNRC
jgi:hypothetical protein